MSGTARATKRNRRQNTVSVSLFPFLAVLICTMGALILVLVVIARQARLQAAQDTVAATAQRRVDLKDDRDLAAWQIGELQQSRQKTESDLAEARLALGHVEDHARRLHDQLVRLEAAWDELETFTAEGSRQREELQAELAKLKAEIDQTQRQIVDSQLNARSRPKSYAVVPYTGPNQTRRRPIYIECRADRILLQPEAIVLTETDFAGPVGPGNPLDVALRATREYLLTRAAPAGDSGEPYPLLLVRPGGIDAYYAARLAMRSWASDFGYELIGEDWPLEFQPPNPGLAEVVNRAIQTARARQLRLAAAAPSHYGSQAGPAFRAAPYRGGLVRDGGGSGDESGLQPQTPFGRVGSRFGADGGSRSTHPLRPEGSLPGRPPTETDQPPGPGSTAQRPGQWQPDASSADDGSAGFAYAGDGPDKLADTRGSNWGLPDAAGGSVPITRPIRIDCYPDRLLLVPEQGLGGSKVIPLKMRTEDAVDELISTIWDHMESWGIAGKGMYWRPVLNLYVAPNAEDRFEELKTLLDGSGLEVKRAGQ